LRKSTEFGLRLHGKQSRHFRQNDDDDDDDDDEDQEQKVNSTCFD